jgi:hypothetical protein
MMDTIAKTIIIIQKRSRRRKNNEDHDGDIDVLSHDNCRPENLGTYSRTRISAL